MPTMRRVIRIVLVDDHFVVRVGLVSSLEEEADLRVVGEAGTAAAAERAVEEHSPDVCLVDVDLPDGSGLDLAARLMRKHPDLRVVILSVHTEEEIIHRAVEAGVCSYLPKDGPREDLLAAVRSAAQGTPFFPESIRRTLAQRMQRPTLSAREAEVLNLIVAGRSNKEIAEVLGLAEITVKQHVSAVLRKLGVMDRTQAATAAIARGLAKLP